MSKTTESTFGKRVAEVCRKGYTVLVVLEEEADDKYPDDWRVDLSVFDEDEEPFEGEGDTPWAALDNAWSEVDRVLSEEDGDHERPVQA
jgi:hypothetical protein